MKMPDSPAECGKVDTYEYCCRRNISGGWLCFNCYVNIAVKGTHFGVGCVYIAVFTLLYEENTL